MSNVSGTPSRPSPAPCDLEPIRVGTDYVVRGARPEDAPALVRVHIESWRTTYTGIVSENAFDQLEREATARESRWAERIRQSADAFYIAEHDARGPVGFSSGGANRENSHDFPGELYAIYVLKSHQGKGVGRALVREVTRHLLSIGVTSMIVWVLEANPYRRFYEKLGGLAARRRVVPVAGTPLPEIGYGWPDITPLAR